MTELPNLYSFATKELAQDAMLAYIIAWARPVYGESHPHLHRLGTDMLHALLAAKIGEVGVPTVTSLHVATQVHRIDVLARINDENKNGLILLVEDKVETDERSNQIESYIETAKKRYPNRTIVPVYMKTGNVSRRQLPSEGKCGRFLRLQLLDILKRYPDTCDTIVDNFRTHLQGWENETNSYRDVPVCEWKGKPRGCEGFYTELETRLLKSWGADCCGWEYVNNPAGRFCAFVFAENSMVQEPRVSIYLQIEDATRLTVRLGDWSGPGIRAPIMYEVLELLEDSAPQADAVRIKKAGRFRGGGSGAVAEITFGDEDGYLAQKDGGIVDMEATMQRLVRVRDFVAEVASLRYRS